MSALLDAARHPVAVWAGWTALVVLWESLVVALGLAAWRALRAGAPADRQHRAALAALALCVASLVAAPTLLAWWPPQSVAAARPRVVSAGGRRPGAASVGVLPTTATTVVAPMAEALRSLNMVAGTAGLVWFAGSAVLLVRLAGGWWMAGRLRARAVRVADGEVLETLRGMPGDLQPPRGIDVLESGEVEAPVVIGARRPALIVPSDLRAQLGATALAPLVAHECAHVRRADYAANLAQSAAEAALFFSPAVHWISRVVRETREYCCDDAAVRWCGDDRSAYVQALAALAALGSRNRTQPALGAAGPRLVTRVRRLLKREPTRPRAVILSTALAFAVLGMLGAGWPLVAFSARQAGHVQWRDAASRDNDAPGVPVGWVPMQPGSSVELGPVVATSDHGALAVTLRNAADVDVTSVTLVAVVRGRSSTRGPGPITTVVSPPTAVAISPGATAVVRFLPAPQLGATRAAIGEPRQVFVGLARVGFANGWDWSTTPNPAATTEEGVLSLPPGSVPRSLVNHGTPTGAAICVDDQGLATSQGGVLPVRKEPGRMAICDRGVWLDYQIPDGPVAPPPAAAGVRPGTVSAPAARKPAWASSSAPAQASLPATRITIDVNNASLSEALSTISSAAHIAISADSRVPNAAGLNVRFTNAAVTDVLDFVCQPLGLAYRVVDERTVIVLLAAPNASRTQVQSVPGEVPPVPTKEVRPQYSRALLDAGIQGTVLVDIVISAEGKVTEAEVKRSLGPVADAEAVRCAKQWEFKPGTKDGVPVEVKTALEFTFTLKN